MAIISDARNSTRLDRPEWRAAKQVGMEGERRVAAVFRTLGLLVEQVNVDGTKVDAFDLQITGSIEVKCDRRCSETGNLAVELEHRGHPSGIVTSTASGWCFVVDDEAIL